MIAITKQHDSGWFYITLHPKHKRPQTIGLMTDLAYTLTPKRHSNIFDAMPLFRCLSPTLTHL